MPVNDENGKKDIFAPREYNPEAPEFHSRPPFPPYYPWNDTVPAWVTYPGMSCCPDEPPECLCITSADVSGWDSVYETVSANSGQWGGDLSEYSAYWQNTYSSVYENSAKWNSAADQDITDLSARWEQAYSAVSACKSLIDTYSAQAKLETKSPIIGDGTTENPITIDEELKTKVSEAYSLVHELIYQLYDNIENKISPEIQEWIDKDSLDEMNRCIIGLNVSAGIFEDQVAKLWDAIKLLNSGKVIELVSYKYAPEMTKDNASEYIKPMTIYYNEE